MRATTAFEFLAVTPERLADLARFSERHGKFRYCWCMRWRMRSSAFGGATKDGRAAALEGMVRDGAAVGVLAYLHGEPVGCCSAAPRESYDGLERYRALPRLDDRPVWAVVCFFVDRAVRRRGLTRGLLKAAVAYARSQGAAIVEGYPVEPGARSYSYMGSPATFRAAGFRDVTPRGQARMIMRHGGDRDQGARPGTPALPPGRSKLI